MFAQLSRDGKIQRRFVDISNSDLCNTRPYFKVSFGYKFKNGNIAWAPIESPAMVDGGVLLLSAGEGCLLIRRDWFVNRQLSKARRHV